MLVDSFINGLRTWKYHNFFKVINSDGESIHNLLSVVYSNVVSLSVCVCVCVCVVHYFCITTYLWVKILLVNVLGAPWLSDVSRY